MTDELISAIQSFTLAARAELETETGQQLEGIYGWLPDGSFARADKYQALAVIDEARETRRRLEQLATDEQAVGVAAKDARHKLIRETAFTWLNRLAAFRLMEERRLLKQTVARLGQSNGFIYWLTDDKTPEGQQAYALHQQGSLPLNDMGEGPSDVAYRRFLLWQCGELAREVSLLFDPGTLASLLCPRPSVLKQIVNAMNADACIEAWKPGNEETIGWIYQAFNEKELQAAFASAREQGKKFEAEDIPAVTQLFTIRWVVRFLVENTLGRLWVEMHPDSRLTDSLSYLVPVGKSQNRAPKAAREIRFLDPCCGSMHFGLVAFDIFVEIYREELERAGESGWPAEASVTSSDEIPSRIIANNIYGIDLDLRAVQLSTLTLLLRARTLNPQCGFTDKNLACANIEEITAGRLEEFIEQAKFSHPIYERIIRALATHLKDSNNLGSLLRLDRDFERLVAEERRKVQADNQFILAFPGLTSEQFKTQAGIDEFFTILSDQVMQHLDDFVQASRTSGKDAGHFVSEAAKGLRFMRVIGHRFDVVTTNPPYLSGRKMNKRLAALMSEQYKEGKGDLYAAFIVRCQELLNDSGLMGMLTMHSFMFISSYEQMRANLRNKITIKVLLHFGGGLFAVGNPGTLQTAAFVLRREPEQSKRDENEGLYFRLVKEPDSESKRRTFEAACEELRAGQTHPILFRALQRQFDVIPGSPWSYIANEEIRSAFARATSLSDLASVLHGLSTTDNRRFLRTWWEVGKHSVGFNCADEDAALRTGQKWFPYMKGGKFGKWFGNQDWVVNWSGRGIEVCEMVKGKYRNTEYAKGFTDERWNKLIEVWVVSNRHSYFQRGVTFSTIGNSRFNCRLSPGGFIFDVSGSMIFPNDPSDTLNLLAVMNSELYDFFLSVVINPTIHFQVGDLARLPILESDGSQFDRLASEAVELAKRKLAFNELSFDFRRPSLVEEEIQRLDIDQTRVQDELNKQVYDLFGISDATRGSISAELATRETDATQDTDEEPEPPELEEKSAPRPHAVSWLSYAIGTVLGRFKIAEPGGLGCGDFPDIAASNICKLVNSGGIMASDKGHPYDIVKLVLNCLEFMLGHESAHATIRTASDDDGDVEALLRTWIDRQFWKYHYALYRKRPIYWPLQSPKKKFTIWIFHERFGEDTVFKIRADFVEPKVRWLEARIKELKAKVLTSDTHERRIAERKASQLEDVLDDVQEFAKRLKSIVQLGYTPHIDDGVLLNAAPLWQLLPAWPGTKKAWQELEAGEYDWAQQAMEYWPDRVRERCKTNKSFAIAHGLV